MISRSRRDSVGGGVVAEFVRDLQEPTRFSGGGGVVAEFFSYLQEPTWGGGGSRIFSVISGCEIKFLPNIK